ncbi:fatty acid desaturase family protein [Cellulosimicrobium protaetiae]|uniref:Acyl-CoA desaturase n=1 Tax=Cellulosimicrobium protaetiae TaxID=2587808 RepID=A0A6M5UGJ7_9MICO|nr:acyl-CoA desaturase [Cellulosimicrobium protaetiae]QJW37194.1 acyl-CoA desaturase [Cellulosimicrobium protaetiae]
MSASSERSRTTGVVARARPSANRTTRDYSVLAKIVRESGLLRRRYAYYWTRLVLTVAALGAVWAGVVLVGDSWWQLALAAALALVLSQLAFLGHDSSHRQIFRSRAWNDWTARILANALVGLSHVWWTTKHDAHHAAPNQEGHDPDISPGVVAFTPAALASRRGWRAWLAHRQGWYFFPLLTLEGLHLHVASVRKVLGRGPVPHRGVEVPVLLARLALYLVALGVLLPPALALAFLAVQLAVFGVLLGGAFAPNHKGMPIVPATADIDFLRRQVLMSRNIRGGAVVDFLMGGLNRQVEHHLFPSMPRPNLRTVQPLVREYCSQLGVTYTEVGFFASYRIVIGYLNDVPGRARDPFSCPLAAGLGR